MHASKLIVLGVVVCFRDVIRHVKTKLRPLTDGVDFFIIRRNVVVYKTPNREFVVGVEHRSWSPTMTAKWWTRSIQTIDRGVMRLSLSNLLLALDISVPKRHNDVNTKPRQAIYSGHIMTTERSENPTIIIIIIIIDVTYIERKDVLTNTKKSQLNKYAVLHSLKTLRTTTACSQSQ